ncbi:hypothetical protein NVP3058O_026 [Vibrio phage 3.058.O._10N.286.46.B8]|nr:hypothetical protein NVP2058O_027 [Vibrio phage 2.058.O._10N.286.46.B8]AUS03096.1 hypothetical protein NVP3058O_026 [Vibrio phage 3.058.O._10N.286.46.B8]
MLTYLYDSNPPPEGVYEGKRALTTQNYIEANVKNGVQHEGSTLLLGVSGNASNDTIFLTGALPVSLKARDIGYSGIGVKGSIYESPIYTGGSVVGYQNSSALNPVIGLSQIIVGATISDDGNLVFAPTYSIGNQSRQGKGISSSIIGNEHILKPNTAYLFRLTSLDTQSQDISSYLSWYEGELDLPI